MEDNVSPAVNGYDNYEAIFPWNVNRRLSFKKGLMFNLNVLEHQWVVTAVYFGDVCLLGCGC